MVDDAYGRSGEYIDVLSREAWQVLGVPIGRALRTADPGRGPILDLGAGTGLGTQLAAGALPAARVLAVEPSPVLRAVLLARLAADESLRQRVTVLATDAGGMRLPERLGGALAINMIGHLTPERRRELWQRLRAPLGAAPLIVNLQPPAEPAVIPETTFASVTIGDHTYQGSGAARPGDGGTAIWTMRYRTLLPDGTVAGELVVDYLWQVISPATLLAELAAAGYAARREEHDVVVATPLP